MSKRIISGLDRSQQPKSVLCRRELSIFIRLLRQRSDKEAPTQKVRISSSNKKRSMTVELLRTKPLLQFMICLFFGPLDKVKISICNQ